MGVLIKRSPHLVEIITAVGPILVILIIYFVRLETRITKILTDLCWMKKELKNCRPS